MQQIKEIQPLTEVRKDKIALSTPSDALTKRTQIRQQLVILGMARKEAMGDGELLLYSRGLEPYSLPALSRVIGRLSTTKRAEYEPKIPELADLIDMVRVEARKENPIGDCIVCDNRRIVVIERDGARVAMDCECRIEWKRRQGAAVGD